MYMYIHPGKLTWIPKMMIWKMYLILNMVIFGIYVKFLGCIHPGSQVFFCLGKGFAKFPQRFTRKFLDHHLIFLPIFFAAAFDRTSSEKFLLRSKNRQQTSAER